MLVLEAERVTVNVAVVDPLFPSVTDASEIAIVGFPPPPARLTLNTNASVAPPANVGWNTPGVVGKGEVWNAPDDAVSPVT